MKRLLLITLLGFLTLNDDFVSFKTEMERKVKGIASEMEAIFGKRCDSNIATCQTQSYNECQGTSTKKCYEDFPVLEGCLGGGSYLSEMSAVRFPPSINFNDLTNEQKQFICTSALLEDKFQELNTDRNRRYSKAYIGTSLGLFRSYPTSKIADLPPGQCSGYDPRFRPWYVAATSGAKNVLIFIDISGSMEGDRLFLAKNAAEAVIGTLSNNDFLGVVSFNGNAQSVHFDRIVRATKDNKQQILKAIEELSTHGQTNYEAAIRRGFSMLSASSRDQYGAPCVNGENIFLFLTDGEPTDGLNTSSQLIDLVKSYNKQIKFFTYALGLGANTTILHQLSCEFEGILFEIKSASSTSSLTTIMRNYYTYISEGLEITEAVWTEPYIDSFGFGRMVTVSMPIYYEENGIRVILGVAGIDILWGQIESFGLSEEQSLQMLVRNAACLISNLEACEIDRLRDKKCGVVNCSNQTSISSCSETAGNVFYEPVDTGSYKCCGLTIAAFAGIMVGAIVGVVLIAVGICCICRHQNKSEEDEDKYKASEHDMVPHKHD